MATAEPSKQKKGHQKKEVFTMQKPLFAVACVGKNGFHNDRQARYSDYVSALLSFHLDFGLDAMYQVIGSKDEKESEDVASKYRTEHLTGNKNMDANKIQRTRFRMDWKFNNDNSKDNELMLFVQEVRQKLNDREKNGYDGLVFVLTGCAELGQNDEDVDPGFQSIADSSGKHFMKLMDIFIQFDKNHCRGDDYPKFPVFFFIDRYCAITPEQIKLNSPNNDKKKAISKLNLKYSGLKAPGKGYLPPNTDKTMNLSQFHACSKPYLIIHEEVGGIVTRAIRQRTQIKPQGDGGNDIKHFFIGCEGYILVKQQELPAISALRRMAEHELEVRFPWSCWK